MVFTLPALASLRKLYPQAYIAWLVDDRCAGLLEEGPAASALGLVVLSLDNLVLLNEIRGDFYAQAGAGRDLDLSILY